MYYRMVAFRRVYVQPQIGEKGESRLLQLHGRVDELCEEGEVVDKWEQLGPKNCRCRRIHLFFDLLVFLVDAVESGSRNLFTKTSVSF